jgi:hypothetical protein
MRASAVNRNGSACRRNLYGASTATRPRATVQDKYKRGGAIQALQEDPSSEAQKKALEDSLTKVGADKESHVPGAPRTSAPIPDEIDQKIEKAVTDIEAVCRPILVAPVIENDGNF